MQCLVILEGVGPGPDCGFSTYPRNCKYCVVPPQPSLSNLFAVNSKEQNNPRESRGDPCAHQDILSGCAPGHLDIDN